MMYRPCNAALLLLASTALCSLQPAAAEAVAESTTALPPAAQSLTPLPEGDPAVIDSTAAAALLAAPETTVEPTHSAGGPALPASPSATTTIVVPYGEVAAVVDSLEETAPATDPHGEGEDGRGSSAIAQAQPVMITGVEVVETADGFTLQLEADGELATPTTSVMGNAAIADIPNAVLQLPDGEEFLASDPAAGIALIDVVNLPDNVVRIAVTGTDAPPAVAISVGAAGLIVVGAPGDPTVVVPDDETIQVLVTGEQADDDYFVPNASTATRTDTPLRDVPQSIQVIPRQLIEDQQATSIAEVLENAAGVGAVIGRGDGSEVAFSIRGFRGAPILRDGFILSQLSVDPTGPEVANLERVEVLRGPASVLYGQAEPGGVINVVTKQPLAEPYYKVQLQGGNRGFISPSLDLSGPLTEDGSVRYRLNALVRREESFRDFNNNLSRSFIAPTLAWDISDQTDLTVSFEYLDGRVPADQGLVAIGEEVADIPYERVLGDPDNLTQQEFLTASYTLEHRFSDNWQLRNQFRYTDATTDRAVVIPISVDESTGDLFRSFTEALSEANSYSLYTNVQGQFNTGSIEHQLLFGVDLFRTEVETASDFFFNILPSPSGNIFDPDSLDVDIPNTVSITPSFSFSSITTTNQLGVYLQDQINLLDNLILVAGLRYDTVEQERTNSNNTETDENDDALTPRIGIVYQPIEPISIYANYSRSFVPNSGLDANDDPLEPTEGEGFEVGIRGEIIENRLTATLAYFDITKQNVATADPNNPGFSITVGEQRSRGVDFSLSGEISPGWNVIASYAYIDAETTEDNTISAGNRLPSIPKHSASLWTTYEIQSGNLQGLGLGLGFNYVGEREGDFDNTFRLGSYFRTDAAVFYRRDDWRFQVNVDNLFDIDYVESSTGFLRRLIYPGAPTTVRASMSYTF